MKDKPHIESGGYWDNLSKGNLFLSKKGKQRTFLLIVKPAVSRSFSLRTMVISNSGIRYDKSSLLIPGHWELIS